MVSKKGSPRDVCLLLEKAGFPGPTARQLAFPQDLPDLFGSARKEDKKQPASFARCVEERGC